MKQARTKERRSKRGKARLCAVTPRKSHRFTIQNPGHSLERKRANSRQFKPIKDKSRLNEKRFCMLPSRRSQSESRLGQTNGEPSESFIPQQFMHDEVKLGQTQSNLVKPSQTEAPGLFPRPADCQRHNSQPLIRPNKTPGPPRPQMKPATKIVEKKCCTAPESGVFSLCIEGMLAAGGRCLKALCRSRFPKIQSSKWFSGI